MLLLRTATIGVLFAVLGGYSRAPAGEPLAKAVADPKTRESGQPGAVASPKKQTAVTISKETTYILGPLRADGFVDYAAVLNEEYSRGITPENNAAVLLLQAFGPAVIPDKSRERFLRVVGQPNLPKKGDYFLSRESFLKSRRTKESAVDDLRDESRFDRELERAMQGPWSKEDCPWVAAWVKANEKPLRLVIEATGRPRYFCPLIAEDEDSCLLGVSYVWESKNAAQLLAARAMLRVQAGNTKDAWEDLLACHRLARLLGQGPTMVDMLVGLTGDGWACAGDRFLLHHGKLRAEQLRAMREQYDRLGPLPGLAGRLRGERFVCLDALCVVARDGPARARILTADPDKKSPAVRETLAKWITDVTVNWDEVLRIGNAHFDAVETAMRKPTQAERCQAMDDISRKVNASERRICDPKIAWNELLGGNSPRTIASRRMGAVFVGLFHPAMEAGLKVEERIHTQRTLTDVSFALAAYRADRGEYPPRLADLRPTYLKEMPKDSFTGAELIYKRAGAGYLLYSLGRNGRDDGRNRNDELPPDQEPDLEADDIAVRMPAAGGHNLP